MKNIRILNLHGFLGAADNKNYKALCDIIGSENIISPQLSYKTDSPTDIIAQLSALVTDDNFIFVGQSLGGWYANQLSRKFDRPCILTNPCYYPHELELIKKSGIPSEYLEQYSELSNIGKNTKAYTLCSDADSILPDNFENCKKLSEQVIHVHGSHSTIENLRDELMKLSAVFCVDEC